MTSTLQVHPPPSGGEHRFTVEDFYNMVPAGLLEEDSRVELLEGHVIPMAPIGPEHHWILRDLLEAFVIQEHGRFQTEPGRSLPIPYHNVPEPDLMLCRPGAVNRRKHVRPEGVLLVIEIADSTLERDLGVKANIYREAKIPEYWVVDVQHRCLHIFGLVEDLYEKALVSAGKVSPKALPGVEIDVDLLFGGDEA